MEITHVVWDWNGTLLDDLDLSIETINSILEENKLKKINKEEYRKNFCFPIIKYYDNVGLDISGNNFNELSKKFIERYQPKSRKCQLVKNTIIVLERIKQLGINQIILSASRIDYLEKQVNNAGIQKYFIELLGLSDIQAKSKKEIGLDWKIRNKINGEEILVIGDTYHDYEVSETLGAKFLYYSKGHQEINHKEIIEEKSINNLQEIIAYLEEKK